MIDLNHPNPPQFWNLLCSGDKEAYLALRASLSKPSYRNQRNHSGDRFLQVLDEVGVFVHSREADKITRALVAGFYRLNNAIAINVKQFVCLYPKCKSSVNQSLQTLNFGAVPSKSDIAMEFFNLFPDMRNDFSFARQWTIRTFPENTPKIQTPPPPPVSDIFSTETFNLSPFGKGDEIIEPRGFTMETPPELDAADCFGDNMWFPSPEDEIIDPFGGF